MISEIKEIMKKHVKVAAWVSNELLKRAQSTFASVSSTFPLYMITKSYLFNQPCRIFNVGVDFFYYLGICEDQKIISHNCRRYAK